MNDLQTRATGSAVVKVSLAGGLATEPRPPVRWPLPAVFLVGLVLFCYGQLAVPGMNLPLRLALISLPLLLFAGLLATKGLWERGRRWLLPLLEQHTDALDALPDRYLPGWIALASCVGLFTELVLIRWHASTFHLFAYYKNVSLLAAFLGLGIGYALGRKRPVFTPLVLPALGVQFLVLHALRFAPLREVLQNPVSEQGGLGIVTGGGLARASMSYGFMILVFAFTVLTCLPLGHLAARLMMRRPPLVAYGWNLLGSLLGIGLFTLICSAWSPPAVWLLVAAAGVLPFLLLRPSGALLGASLALVVLPLVLLSLPLHPDHIEIHSPYQMLTLGVERGKAPSLEINHVYYQRILDLGANARQDSPDLEAAAYYELPYRFKPAPGRVLVVGSGTGNDVAAALRRQAAHVDAVEIDPAILRYGRMLHPENPYASDRVDAILDDARSFIRQTDQQYDLIVYGLLDSHTLLSGLSSVRLDSFVYTVEGFREARTRLKSDGLIAMTFSLLSPQQGRKFFLMLQEAFDGQEPRVFETKYDHGCMFVIGPGLDAASRAGTLPVDDVTATYRDPEIVATPSTDDWPFLYMPVRKYPLTYVVMVVVLLVVSLLVVYQLLPVSRGSSSQGYSTAACFFLGAGFMLVETRGITELGLVLGNTWQVISAVIAAILVMAFLANLVILRRGTPHPLLSYGLIAAALVLGMVVPSSALAGLSRVPRQLLAMLLVTLPLFFSGFAFSGELKRHANMPAALSANLLGAMLGGFLEYNSMYFGFRSLYLFALVLYALAFVPALLGRRAGTAAPAVAA